MKTIFDFCLKACAFFPSETLEAVLCLLVLNEGKANTPPPVRLSAVFLQVFTFNSTLSSAGLTLQFKWMVTII